MTWVFESWYWLALCRNSAGLLLFTDDISYEEPSIVVEFVAVFGMYPLFLPPCVLTSLLRFWKLKLVTVSFMGEPYV